MGVEDEGEVDVHDDDDGCDHEENLKHASWENWALVCLGCAVILVFFVIGSVAWVGLNSVPLGSEEVCPLLREPTQLSGECDVVDEDVLVGDQVDDSDQGNDEAEDIQHQPAVHGSVLDVHHEEGNEHSNFKHGADEVGSGELFEKAKN